MTGGSYVVIQWRDRIIIPIFQEPTFAAGTSGGEHTLIKRALEF